MTFKEQALEAYRKEQDEDLARQRNRTAKDDLEIEEKFTKQFGVVPESVTNRVVTVEDGTRIWAEATGYGDWVWRIVGKCDKCGATIHSYACHNLGGIGKSLNGENWEYHNCNPELTQTETIAVDSWEYKLLSAVREALNAQGEP